MLGQTICQGVTSIFLDIDVGQGVTLPQSKAVKEKHTEQLNWG